MNKNEKFVITINRELGSGGRTVGEKLAAKLGVPFYDKALIKALTEKYNLTVEEIERLKGRKHGWWADFKRVVGIGQVFINSSKYYEVEMGKETELLTTGEMYKVEKEIVKGIAADESCVIAGFLHYERPAQPHEHPHPGLDGLPHRACYEKAGSEPRGG